MSNDATLSPPRRTGCARVPSAGPRAPGPPSSWGGPIGGLANGGAPRARRLGRDGAREARRAGRPRRRLAVGGASPLRHGPSLVMMVEYWQKLFARRRSRFEDYVELVQIDPCYRIRFPDGHRARRCEPAQAAFKSRNASASSPAARPGLLRVAGANAGQDVNRRPRLHQPQQCTPWGRMVNLPNVLGTWAAPGLFCWRTCERMNGGKFFSDRAHRRR